MSAPPFMPYVANTEADQAHMLRAIGVDSVDALFAAVPEALRLREPLGVPPALCEAELRRHMEVLAGRCASVAPEDRFQGAGLVTGFVPAAVDHIASLGGFLTAYTPYQAEASQGTLQAIFEFQTLMCRLFDMEAANASMYDGATALVEACLMAGAATKKRSRLVLAGTIHPEWLRTLRTYLQFTEYSLDVVEPDASTGAVDAAAFAAMLGDDVCGVAVQYPNFWGRVEDVLAIGRVAHDAGALFIVAADPIACAVLKPPGLLGADIAVGEGQPLGTYPHFGGPTLGIFSTRSDHFPKRGEHLRKLPGRVVGETTDTQGRRGFVLALQTREQHIRRARATSNICTNQGLVALRAAVYLAMLGGPNLAKLATQVAQKTAYAKGVLGALDGFAVAHAGSHFREFVVSTPKPAAVLFDACAKDGVLAGVPLSRYYADRPNELLVSFSEMNTKASIDRLAEALDRAARG